MHYSFAKIEIPRELDYWWCWLWWLCWRWLLWDYCSGDDESRPNIVHIVYLVCIELRYVKIIATLYCRGHRRQGTLGCIGSEQEYCGIDLKRRTIVIEHWEPLKPLKRRTIAIEHWEPLKKRTIVKSLNIENHCIEEENHLISFLRLSLLICCC